MQSGNASKQGVAQEKQLPQSGGLLGHALGSCELSIHDPHLPLLVTRADKGFGIQMVNVRLEGSTSTGYSCMNVHGTYKNSSPVPCF